MAIDPVGYTVFKSWEKEQLKETPEPTREQIKEAFKATIERWEKIVEDPFYFNQSHCELCKLRSGFSCKDKPCPVALYVDTDGCLNTPYMEFSRIPIETNALAELNFLRKVYIWWMEREDCKSDVVKEEKKEEWEDITEKLVLSTEQSINGRYFLRIAYQGTDIGIIYRGQLSFYHLTYKAEYSAYTTSILKKK